MFKQKFAIKTLGAILITENQNAPFMDKENKSVLLGILDANGYRLSREALTQFIQSDVSEETGKSILSVVKSIKGSDVNHNILIGKFPQKTDFTQFESSLISFINYISGYFGGVSMLRRDEELYPLTDDVKYQNLNCVTTIENDVKSLFKTKIPLSLDHEEFVTELYASKDKLLSAIDPKEIILKELLARQVALELEENDEDHISARSAIDVLRAVALISGEENAKLDTHFKIKSLSNPIRRKIVATLDRVANIDDLVAKKGLFKKLLKIVHVHEKKFEKYANIRALALQLQTINNPRTTRTELHKIINGIGTKEGFDIILGNPSLFIRHLDSILRKHDSDSILELFQQSLKTRDVETKLLVQILEHFRNRDEYLTQRLFTPKGKSSPVVVEKTLEALEKDVIEKLDEIIKTELVRQYSKKDTYFERAYIDPELYKINVPRSLSDQDGLKILARGSRLKVKGDGDILRLFVHWKYRCDIDLSASVLDEDYETIRNINFGSISGPYWEHSGDVRSAPNGGSEFIDIDLKSVPKNCRYILVGINDYSGNAFDEIPELFAGFMMRDDHLSGKAFDARTVENKFSISGGVGFKYTLMYDVLTREVIMINATKSSYAGATIYSNNISNMLREILNRKYVTVGELIELNSKYVLCEDEQLTMTRKELDQVSMFDADFGTNIIEITSKLL